ncbi:MAG: dihydrofolate reductase family protein [Brevinema sp.]
MNNRIVYYVASSLDGFIADKNGNIDWLEQTPSDGDNGYGEFIQQVGIIFMGGSTYRKILSFGIDWPYKNIPCYIFTRQPHQNEENIFFISGDIENFLYSLPVLPENKIIWLVGGFNLASQCWEKNLINELHLAQAPVLLGDGIPLFPKKKMSNMSLKNTQRRGEFIMSQYIFNNKAAPLN